MSDDIKIAQEKAEEKKDRTGAEQDKNLDKLTDRVEDEGELDESKAHEAMAAITASQAADREAQRLRDKELAAVKVRQEDILIVSSELEIDKKSAEKRLRENKGDIKATLESFL